MNIKQVIVMRKDLKMRRGKEIAQGSHASMAWLSNRLKNASFPCGDFPLSYTAFLLDDSDLFSDEENEWLQGSFAKICLQVNSEEELDKIYDKAKKANFEVHMIIDSGKTEFNGIPTKTCLAIGPHKSEKIDKITGSLKLY